MLSGILNLLGIFLLPPFLVLPLVLRPVSDGVVLNMENRVSFIFFFLVLLMGKDIFVGTIYPLKMLILFCLNLMFVLYIYAIASFYMSLCFILLHTPFFER